MSFTPWFTRSSPTVSWIPTRAATSTLVPTPSVERTSTARGEVGHEAPRERVTGAGGIEHLLERVGGDLERGVVVHEQGAVLALLDDGYLGPVLEHPACRAVDVPIARELVRLGVVHHQDIDVAQQLEQQVPLGVDPVVH